MFSLTLKKMTLEVDFQSGNVVSLIIDGKERIAEKVPLFKVGLRSADGEQQVLSAYGAHQCKVCDGMAVYSDFGMPDGDISVSVALKDNDGEAEWCVSVAPSNDSMLVEWVEFPTVNLPALKDNNHLGNGGEILFPFNEGGIVSDLECREDRAFGHSDPEYPSKGSFAVFPNMICSQMLAYLWEGCGLYIGIHDPRRGVKAIDFYGDGCGVTMQIRLYCGVDFGEAFEPSYPVVWSVTKGNWESAAERYRTWFESCLPPRAKKIDENSSLPEWYADSPLVITYPVRGRYDTDKMTPNALYPYTNALPIIEEIKKATDSRVLVLLMHWEGTAPWAPPYVWPPYGDKENFDRFVSELHKKDDLLGVYCSGFGYTVKSNLIEDYNKEDEFESENLKEAMCAGPDGKVEKSRICTAQRSGYDVCPASERGRKLLADAYTPLFESGIDYAQILDQNHGGGQYFCYSRDHGHPPAPGEWMTENMQRMLSEWNGAAEGILLGCESAASEPFIGNLLFSDNRFELNYYNGIAVPLYAYIYHQYLRNFMGNQVSCPFMPDDETLCYRLAYSFVAGDCMTLVLSPEGDLTPNWGRPRYKVPPNKEKTLKLISNLTRFYREEAKPYLYSGRMMPCDDFECGSIIFAKRESAFTVTLPSVLATAWAAEDGKRAYILVNPEESEQVCTVKGEKVTLPPMMDVS